MLVEFAKRLFWVTGVLMWGLNCECAPVNKRGSTSHFVQYRYFTLFSTLLEP